MSIRKASEKSLDKMKKKMAEAEAQPQPAETVEATSVEAAPEVPVETTDDLLREIRDLLKANAEAGVKVNEKAKDKKTDK